MCSKSKTGAVVEVFVERDCPACNDVIALLNNERNPGQLEVRVYERDRDLEHFHRRGVLICPATYVNNRLAFYGSFTTKELTHFIHCTSTHVQGG